MHTGYQLKRFSIGFQFTSQIACFQSSFVQSLCVFSLLLLSSYIHIALNRIRCGYYNFITVVVPQSNMENNSWCVYNVGWCTSIYLINIHVQTRAKGSREKTLNKMKTTKKQKHHFDVRWFVSWNQINLLKSHSNSRVRHYYLLPVFFSSLFFSNSNFSF